MSPAGPPAGYREDRWDGARIVARHEALQHVGERIAAHGSLYAYAAAHPDARTIEGRRRIYVVPAPGGGRWLVRRLSHGGLLAPITGDLFLRAGVPRPLNELRLACELRRRSIRTPAVAAAVVYGVGPLLYRGEVAREEVPDALDLAACLFGPRKMDSERRPRVLAAAGALIGALHRVGLSHPDLNLRNVLVRPWDAEPAAYILDLEKCRLLESLSGWRRDLMLGRLRRSARRFEERTGERLGAAEWAAFDQTYAEALTEDAASA